MLMRVLYSSLFLFFVLLSVKGFSQCPPGTTPSGIELVNNGDFSAGDVGFNTTYNHVSAGANGGLEESEYVVSGPNANQYHFAASNNFQDHTTGNGNFMMLNGAGVANTDLWCQTISVTPNTTYQFSAWIATWSSGSPATLQFSVNGVNLSVPFVASNVEGQWNQFFATWNSGANVTATICIVNQNLSFGGNDFCMDDISFQPCNCAFNTQTQIVSHTTCNQCDGEAIVTASNGSGNYSYTWNATGATTNAASNLCAGAHLVSVIDASNPNCTSVVSVSINPSSVISPTATITSSISCANSCDAVLSGSATGGDPASYVYTWLPGSLAGANAAGLCAGSYTLSVTDANNCVGTTTISLLAPTSITVAAVSQTLCPGVNTVLTATVNGGSPNYSYTWVGPGAVYTSSTVPYVATTTEVFSIVVQDDNNCNSSPITFTVSVVPTLTLAVSNATVCAGFSASLTANVTGGDGNYIYTWDPPTNLNSTNTAVVQANPNVPTDYTVTINDGCGVPTSSVVSVIINQLPNVLLSANNHQGCDSLCITFSNNTLNTANCIWNFGDGAFDNTCSATVTHCYETPGVYTPTLAVTDLNGCSSFSVDPTPITVFSTPDADFITSPSTTSITDPDIEFIDQSSGASITWQWALMNPNQDVFSSLQQANYTFDDTGTYQIQLVVTSIDGCTDTSYNDVVINPEYLFYIPNTFTPNGDNLNDLFLPIGMAWKEGSYTFRVYDRWGNLVFETKNPNVAWNGKWRNTGEPLSQDVYVWQISLRDSVDSNNHLYTGRVTIVR